MLTLIEIDSLVWEKLHEFLAWWNPVIFFDHLCSYEQRGKSVLLLFLVTQIQSNIVASLKEHIHDGCTLIGSLDVQVQSFAHLNKPIKKLASVLNAFIKFQNYLEIEFAGIDWLLPHGLRIDFFQHFWDIETTRKVIFL